MPRGPVGGWLPYVDVDGGVGEQVLHGVGLQARLHREVQGRPALLCDATHHHAASSENEVVNQGRAVGLMVGGSWWVGGGG